MAQTQARRVHLETLETFASRLGIEYIDIESFVQSVQVPREVAEDTFERAEADGIIEPVEQSLYRIC